MQCLVVIAIATGALVACQSDEVIPDAPTGTIDAAGQPDGALEIDAAEVAPDADTSGFIATSTAYDDGGVIPTVHSCDGANTSPDLTWTAWPDALSYGVLFNDASTNFKHSAMYDIDDATLSLPAALDRNYASTDVPGMHQSIAYDGDPGYAGPCPGETHTYEFVIYALDVATLPGLDASSSRNEAAALLTAHALATTRLTGTYNPN